MTRFWTKDGTRWVNLYRNEIDIGGKHNGTRRSADDFILEYETAIAILGKTAVVETNKGERNVALQLAAIKKGQGRK